MYLVCDLALYCFLVLHRLQCYCCPVFLTKQYEPDFEDTTRRKHGRSDEGWSGLGYDVHLGFQHI